MYQAFRRAAPLLLAAAAFGLTRPAAAQGPLPVSQAPAADDTPPLPRVVPPRRPSAVPGQAAPGPVPVTAAPSSRFDLLTSPALPSAWSAPPTVAVNPAPKAPAPARLAATSYPASMTPPVPAARPVSTGTTTGPMRTASSPPLLAAPVVASAKPGAPTAAPKKTWPPAFQTRDNSRPSETTGLVSFEKPVQSAKPTAAVKPAPAAAPAAGNLRGRILMLCGPDVVEVAAADQPDKTTLVKVRVRDAAAERKVTEKIMKLPEMTRPMARLEVEVRP